MQYCCCSQNLLIGTGSGQSDLFQYSQDRVSWRGNIQTHEAAAFLAELRAGIETDTGFVNEEVTKLCIGQAPGTAVEPEQIGTLRWNDLDFR